MKTTITIENFESMKYRLLLSVSKFGKMIHPENWNFKLQIFEYDENVADLISDYLINKYTNQ
jgi:hypothetical protein